MDKEDLKDHGKDEAKEDKSKPIKHIHIHRMDNGGYTVRAESDFSGPGNHTYESAHPDAVDAMKMVHNHMTSPHLPKIGFAKLTDTLAQNPKVTNPAGLAAYIGRKKSPKKFDALSR